MKHKLFFVMAVMALFLGLLLLNGNGCVQTQEQNENNPEENLSEGNEAPELPQVNYNTSNKLTEITLTREVDGGTVTQKASFKITGYLKEIAPESNSLTMYSDRAFDFNQGTVEWSMEESETDVGTDCTYITLVTSSGKEAISSLNVPWSTDEGKYPNGSLMHLSDWGNLKLTYKEHGFNSESESEFALAGKILIPLTVTEKVELNKANSICGGYNYPRTATRLDEGNAGFPIVLLGLDLKSSNYAGSFNAFEPYGNSWEGTIVSGYQHAKFKSIVGGGEVPMPGDEAPWVVSWNINLP